MSKVLVIPDVHLKVEVIERGLELAKKYRADTIVMLGDYFDDWHSIDRDYDDMLIYIRNVLRNNPNIIPLFGNHELSYMGYPCSGHNHNLNQKLYDYLYPNYRFLFGVAIDGIFYSHAGVCTQWLKENNLITQNDLRLRLPHKAGATLLETIFDKIPNMEVFSHVGPARGGSRTPSPLWADLTELIADPAPVKQVVGHTPVKQIEKIGKVWFTDCHSNYNESDEYLLVNDGEPEVVHYDEEDYA